MKIRLTLGQWFCLVMALVLTAAAVAAYRLDTMSTESNQIIIGKHKTGVGKLTEAPVSQAFTVGENGLSAVEVMVSNYNKKPKTGALTLWLTDDAGRELARQSYPVDGLKNNAFVTLPLGGVDHASKDKRFTLYAASDCADQKGVTLRMGPMDDVAPGLTLTMADGTVDGKDALYLREVYTASRYGWMAAMTLLLTALCFAACIPMASRKGRDEG